MKLSFLSYKSYCRLTGTLFLSLWLSFTAIAADKPAGSGTDAASAIKPAAKDGDSLMQAIELKKGESDAKNRRFGLVDGKEIAIEDFLHVYRTGIRDSFYHGRVKEKEVEEFRIKVINQLITDELLAQEATRRGLRVTKETIDKKVDRFIEKNKKAKNWDKVKKRLIPAVRRVSEREELVVLLKSDVEKLEKPKNSLVLDYYDKNKEKFTAPERWHISLILLSVDPSSPGSVWDESFEFASELVEKSREGESFEDFARIHSSDPSAADGGDMGYIHIGMLSKPAQEMLNIMKIGDISEPVMLLKGVAIFRLDGLEAPRLNKFEKVKERAGDLLQRERIAETWGALRKSIWNGKKITLEAGFSKYVRPPESVKVSVK